MLCKLTPLDALSDFLRRSLRPSLPFPINIDLRSRSWASFQGSIKAIWEGSAYNIAEPTPSAIDAASAPYDSPLTFSASNMEPIRPST